MSSKRRSRRDDLTSEADLVVVSHLRWTFVWQRPQHIISRLARGRRTWFIEEPLASDTAEPRFRTEEHGSLTRVWLDVPRRPLTAEPRAGGSKAPEEVNVAFDDDRADGYTGQILRLLGERGRPIVWLYTPSGLAVAEALNPRLLVYDVMDDLSSFHYTWWETMRRRQLDALAAADLVFTGGRSLDEGVRRVYAGETHLFPSGVDPDHFAAARRLRRPRERPVAGYIGVLDERLDLDLIAGLAETLSDWDIEMVGPTLKIHPDSLPRSSNLVYPGLRSYEQLPEVLAGFDVALMPFALSEATRSISPTKTLEYLAAGLPVVSTRVPDVVSDYGDIVLIRDDAAGFAEACRSAIASGPLELDPKVESLLHRHDWDTIARRMAELIERALEDADRSDQTASP